MSGNVLKYFSLLSTHGGEKKVKEGLVLSVKGAQMKRRSDKLSGVA